MQYKSVQYKLSEAMLMFDDGSEQESVGKLSVVLLSHSPFILVLVLTLRFLILALEFLVVLVFIVGSEKRRRLRCEFGDSLGFLATSSMSMSLSVSIEPSASSSASDNLKGKCLSRCPRMTRPGRDTEGVCEGLCKGKCDRQLTFGSTGAHISIGAGGNGTLAFRIR